MVYWKRDLCCKISAPTRQGRLRKQEDPRQVYRDKVGPDNKDGPDKKIWRDYENIYRGKRFSVVKLVGRQKVLAENVESF